MPPLGRFLTADQPWKWDQLPAAEQQRRTREQTALWIEALDAAATAKVRVAIKNSTSDPRRPLQPRDPNPVSTKNPNSNPKEIVKGRGGSKNVGKHTASRLWRSTVAAAIPTPQKTNRRSPVRQANGVCTNARRVHSASPSADVASRKDRDGALRGPPTRRRSTVSPTSQKPLQPTHGGCFQRSNSAPPRPPSISNANRPTAIVRSSSSTSMPTSMQSQATEVSVAPQRPPRCPSDPAARPPPAGRSRSLTTSAPPPPRRSSVGPSPTSSTRSTPATTPTKRSTPQRGTPQVPPPRRGGSVLADAVSRVGGDAPPEKWGALGDMQRRQMQPQPRPELRPAVQPQPSAPVRHGAAARRVPAPTPSQLPAKESNAAQVVVKETAPPSKSKAPMSTAPSRSQSPVSRPRSQTQQMPTGLRRSNGTRSSSHPRPVPARTPKPQWWATAKPEVQKEASPLETVMRAMEGWRAAEMQRTKQDDKGSSSQQPPIADIAEGKEHCEAHGTEAEKAIEVEFEVSENEADEQKRSTEEQEWEEWRAAVERCEAEEQRERQMVEEEEGQRRKEEEGEENEQRDALGASFASSYPACQHAVPPPPPPPPQEIRQAARPPTPRRIASAPTSPQARSPIGAEGAGPCSGVIWLDSPRERVSQLDLHKALASEKELREERERVAELKKELEQMRSGLNAQLVMAQEDSQNQREHRDAAEARQRALEEDRNRLAGEVTKLQAQLRGSLELLSRQGSQRSKSTEQSSCSRITMSRSPFSPPRETRSPLSIPGQTPLSVPEEPDELCPQPTPAPVVSPIRRMLRESTSNSPDPSARKNTPPGPTCPHPRAGTADCQRVMLTQSSQPSSSGWSPAVWSRSVESLDQLTPPQSKIPQQEHL